MSKDRWNKKNEEMNAAEQASQHAFKAIRAGIFMVVSLSVFVGVVWTYYPGFTSINMADGPAPKAEVKPVPKKAEPKPQQIAKNDDFFSREVVDHNQQQVDDFEKKDGDSSALVDLANQKGKDKKDLNREKISEAIELIDSGNPEAALEILEEILKDNPNNEEALVEIAMIYLIDFRSPDQALGYLERALEVNPSNKIVLSELVGIYEEQGMSGAGLEKLKSLRESNPDNPSINLGIGQILMNQGQTGEALTYLESAASKAPGGDYIHAELARAYGQMNQPEKQIGALRKGRDKISGTDNIANEQRKLFSIDIVRTLISQGKLEEAHGEIMQLESIKPGDETIALLYRQLQEAQAAGEAL